VAKKLNKKFPKIKLILNSYIMKKLFFICTSNIKRSVTAERLFSYCPDMKTKSAGTHVSAHNPVTQELIDWADIIFVMSEKDEGHITYLKDNFNIDGKSIYDLEITDVYHIGQKELKKILIEKVVKYIDLKPCMDNLLTNLK